MENRFNALRIPATLLIAFFLNSNAFAQQETKSPFEFHAYGRLGITTNEELTSAGKDQGDGAFGIPTSRHIRDTNYLRVQGIGHAGLNSLLNIEAQFENLPHLSNTWNGSGLNLRNAYFQTKTSSDAELWFGARRLEFEDVRLFDRFPLSDTTFYGMGSQFELGGAQTTIAIGFKNQSTRLNIAKNEADASEGNQETATDSRATSIFFRHEYSLGAHAALRPTLILSQSGQTFLNGSPIDSYKTASSDSSGISTVSTPKKTLSGKVGAVLSHWGDEGWGNHFLWLEQRPAQGTTGGSEKDTLIGLASSGDFEAWSSNNFGLMYGLMIEHTQFKIAQSKLSVSGDTLIQKDNATAKSNTTLALGIQPVYYMTNRLHVALDLNHTLTTKVGPQKEVKPNMSFVTPILRYATHKTALATPQFFTSVTYGIYETKARQNASGRPSKYALTTQTGCEFWF